MKGIFKAKERAIFEVHNFKLNCHVCGRTFSPLHVMFIPTDECDYYLDVWCRKVIVFLFKESHDLVCEHISQVISTWIYDPIDSMEGKILEQDKNENP